MRFSVSVRFLMSFTLLLVFVPQPASAGWLEFFFPQLRPKQINPMETMKAPFSDPNAIIDPTVNKSGLGENNVPISLRHRSNAVISKWVESIVSDMLAYDAKTYEQQYKANSALFDTTGLKEYVIFLNSQNVVSSLKSGIYNVRSFVRDAPIIINEGEVGGRYRWLYKVKVMLSFVKVGLQTYKGANEGDEISKEYTVVLHVGRSDKVKINERNEHGLIIEGWSGELIVPEDDAPAQ